MFEQFLPVSALYWALPFLFAGGGSMELITPASGELQRGFRCLIGAVSVGP
jgi:hypothetical protein